MGGDIAAWCAWQGLVVTLADTNRNALGSAVKRAEEARFMTHFDDEFGRKHADALAAIADRIGLSGALQLVPLAPLVAAAAFAIGKRNYASDLDRLNTLREQAKR